MKWFVVAVGACVLLGGAACSSVSFVDEVAVVNDTEYSANIDVTSETRDGWLLLTSVEPHSTTIVKEIIDQGETWIFRFDYIGKYEQEVDFSRRELERSNWTIDVPQSFEQRLRDLNFSPPP